MKFQQLSILSTLLFASAVTFAGAVNGGGGVAVVCRGQHQKITRAELFDLYEAYEVKGLTPRIATGQIEQDYILAVKKTYELQGEAEISVGHEVRENLKRFMKIVRFTDPGQKLPFTNDIGRTEVTKFPMGCGLEQLAIFRDDNESVEIDTEIWTALDSLNQAALVSHELYYRLHRQLKETTSERIRNPVAIIYSKSGGIPVKDGISNGDLACSTNEIVGWESSDGGRSANAIFNPLRSSSFYLKKNSDGLRVQIFNIMGRPLLTKTVGVFKTPAWIFRQQVNSDGDGIELVVAELNADIHEKVPLKTAQAGDWELALDYVTGKRIKIGFYQNGILIDEAYVDSCYQLN